MARRSTAIACSWRRAAAAPPPGATGRVARPHARAAGAVAVHVSHRDAVAARSWPGSPSRRSRRRCRATGLRERGAVLLTHWGLSGPAILRLSAWGARELHGLDYRFPLRLNWLPHLDAEALAAAAPVAPRGAARAAGRQHADGAADRPPLGTARARRGHPAATRAGPRCPGPDGTSSSSNCCAPNCR